MRCVCVCRFGGGVRIVKMWAGLEMLLQLRAYVAVVSKAV